MKTSQADFLPSRVARDRTITRGEGRLAGDKKKKKNEAEVTTGQGGILFEISNLSEEKEEKLNESGCGLLRSGINCVPRLAEKAAGRGSRGLPKQEPPPTARAHSSNPRAA